MKITFGVGIGSDRDGREISNAAELTEKAMNLLAYLYGGVSVVRCEGAWHDKAGQLVREPAIQLQVELTSVNESDQQNAARKQAAALREMFNQSCILVSFQKSEMEFV